jgi:hypothetical protein
LGAYAVSAKAELPDVPNKALLIASVVRLLLAGWRPSPADGRPLERDAQGSKQPL